MSTKPAHVPLADTITVPLRGGSITIARSFLRGHARIIFAPRTGKPVELQASTDQFDELLDAVIARRNALREPRREEP